MNLKIPGFFQKSMFSTTPPPVRIFSGIAHLEVQVSAYAQKSVFETLNLLFR